MPRKPGLGRKTAQAAAEQVRRSTETEERRSQRQISVREATQSRRRAETSDERTARLQALKGNKNRLSRNQVRLAVLCAHIGLASLDDISEMNVDEYYCGEMNFICTACEAKHFKDERTGRSAREMEKFTNCCEKGKVKLPDIRMSPEIKELLTANSTTSKNFIENIRNYNSALAFASMGAQIAPPPGRGPPCFRIHGQVYHRTSPLHPNNGNQPKYAQIYILDAEEALNQRMAILHNTRCQTTLMQSLGDWFSQNNELASAFKMMREVELEEQRAAEAEGREMYPVLMSIRHDRGDDQRRYNAPRCNEIAIVFKTPDGAPPFERDIRVYNRESNSTTTIPITHRSCDPMVYPLLFPYGEDGWTDTIRHVIGNRTVTQLQWYAYHIAVRNKFNQFLSAHKLTQQFLVDAYAKVEGSRLDYIRRNQKALRVEEYDFLKQYLDAGADNAGMRAGKLLILPSSFTGGVRAMNQNYQDAMAIVRKFGKPDLFITMTCNPNWKEITENLGGQPREGRPDLVDRVFQMKLKELLNDLLKKHVLGVHVAEVHVIEFQKRGLPHAHILIILREQDKPKSAELIDRIVSAEIPNPSTHPRLHAIVLKHMIHGPCGVPNPNSPCMEAGKCTKEFPKGFNVETNSNVDGYPKYRRRNTGVKYPSGNAAVDNSWVVPYNPYLLLKYNCHINVEVCASIKSVKYLFKYVYKGHDCANIEFREKTNEVGRDEIKSHLDSRYISAPEAVWRLLKFSMHEQTHAITRLKLNLPGQQPVVFAEGNEMQALANAEGKDNTLTAWFKLNQTDPIARQYLYPEIPEHFTYDKKKRAWHTRKGHLGKIIGRMYSASPTQGELYYLRLLLLNVRGATSYDSLKTVNGELCASFKEAAIRLRLVADDSEWKNCLEEATTFQMPTQLRHLFAYICVFCGPTDPLSLWEGYKAHFIEDYIHQNLDEQSSSNLALLDIQSVLLMHGKKCADFNLPEPTVLSPTVTVNINEEREKGDRMIAMLRKNPQQIKAFEEICMAVENPQAMGNCFYLDGPGGSGKTFLYEALYHHFSGLGLQVECVASTGIAATLLPFGRTYHSAFKLPVPLTETSSSSLRESSPAAQVLRAAKLIVWDEITMTPYYALDAVDRFLRGLMNKDIPFGGKVLLIGGDFRQCLPVVPHGQRAAIVQSCVKSSALWENFRHLKLSKNMRTGNSNLEHDNWLLKLGDGKLIATDLPDNIIEIPPEFVETGDLIDAIFGESISLAEIHNYTESAILTPLNDDVHELNSKVLRRLEGDTVTYTSIDTLECDDQQEVANFPVEFLNTVRSSGLPLHKLELKVGAIIMLLRNLNTRLGLCNGTRLIVKNLQPNLIDAEVLTGRSKGTRIFIPRIDLMPSDGNYPFKLRRRQFPVMLSFVMTINKSQGQSLDQTGIYLPNPVFSHGQLYVAFSRGRHPDKIRVKISEAPNQGKLIIGSDKVFTVNCVYHEVFDQSIPSSDEQSDADTAGGGRKRTAPDTCAPTHSRAKRARN